MSSWKLTKAVMGAQLIWMAIVFSVMFIVGLFVTKDKVPNSKKTKDGFYTAAMQDVYDHYVNKEKGNDIASSI